MIYQESKRVRRVVGCIEEGEECIDSFSDFCREHEVRAAEIRAVGRLSEVEVVRFDSDAGEYTTVYSGTGPFDLLNFAGNVSMLGDEVVVRAEALLAVDGPVQPQLVTGQIRSGGVLEFEFVMELFDDVSLERRLDGETGLLEMSAVRRRAIDGAEDVGAESGERPPSDSLEGQSMSWDDAAAATDETSDSAPNDADRTTAADRQGSRTEQSPSSDPDEIYGDMDFEQPLLEAGDVVDHPKLGRCRVIKVEDQNYAHIRLPKGKIRKLSLSVVEVEYIGEEDGHNVFEAKVGS